MLSEISSSFRIFFSVNSYIAVKNWIFNWKTLPVWSWIRAADLYNRGFFEQAARLYKKGIAAYPNHPAINCALMDLSICFQKMGKISEAEVVLKKLSQKLPHSKRVQKALFKLQLRSGLLLDAAWTLRRAVKNITPDAEMVELYFYCVVDNGGPAFLLKEVLQLVRAIKNAGQETTLMKAAAYRLALQSNGFKNLEVASDLELLADFVDAPIEVSLLAADSLLKFDKVAAARRLLRKALVIEPNHPRVLSLFAQTYIHAGSLYNASYATQLAQNACSFSNWKSPRDMHILAECYSHSDDSLSALATAEKAKREGSRLLGSYKDSDSLDILIAHLKEDIKNEKREQTAA